MTTYRYVPTLADLRRLWPGWRFVLVMAAVEGAALYAVWVAFRALLST
jgi:hypothetical protein